MSTKCCNSVWCTCNEKCKEHRRKGDGENCDEYQVKCSPDYCTCIRHNGTDKKGRDYKLHEIPQSVRNICLELLHYPKGKLSLHIRKLDSFLIFIYNTHDTRRFECINIVTRVCNIIE